MSTSRENYHIEMRRFEKSCRAFMDWRLECDKKKSDIKVDVDFDEFYRYIEELQSKESKKTIDILVAGTTSAGKSALINSLLRMDVLASSLGHCTPGAVLIQPTASKTASYEIEGGKKFDLDLSSKDSINAFWSQIDNVSKERTEDIVRLHLPHEHIDSRSILKKNVSIIDSPGMERPCFKSDKTKTMVKEADAVVILIDLISGLNNQGTVDLLTNSGFFVKPNVIIVFNKCDELDEDEEQPARKTKLIEQGIEQVTAFMTEGKHLTEKEARENIFFLSAREANKARRKGKDLSETSESSSGVSWNGTQYDSDKRTRAVGHRTFEKRLMFIAIDNYGSMKAQRMLLAITQSRVDLLAKAREVQKRLENVNQRISDLVSLQKAFTILEREAKENSRYFYEKFMKGGESSIPGKEKVNKFLDFCRDEGSEPMRKVTEEICKQVDDQLVLFAKMVYEEGMDKTFKESKERYERLFAKTLEPVDEYKNAAIAKSEDELKKLDKEEAEARKRDFEKLQKIREEFNEKERRESDEMKEKREELNRLAGKSGTDAKEKIGYGLGGAALTSLGAGGVVCLATGPVGWIVGATAATAAVLGSAGAAFGYAGKASREKEERDTTVKDLVDALEEQRKRRTEEEKRQSELKEETKKFEDNMEIKKKGLSLQIKEKKLEEKETRKKKLEERRGEHLSALSTFYQTLIEDIQGKVKSAFQDKELELHRALEKLQKLKDEHAT